MENFVLSILTLDINYKNFMNFYKIKFPFQKGAEVKNQSTITTTKRDDRHKKKHTSL
jgi:hypothetical protein